MSNPTDPTRGQNPSPHSPARVAPGARPGDPVQRVTLVAGLGFALAIVGLVVTVLVAPASGEADPETDIAATSTESPATPAAPPPAPATTVPIQQYLADLPPVGSTAYTGAIPVNGVSYPHAIYQQFSGCATEVSHTYDLNGEWSRFASSIGVADGGNSAAVLRFEVIADGASIFSSGNIRVGEPPKIEVPVTGVQNLTIGFTLVDGSSGSCTALGNGVWGDPILTK
ncbi:NPCBM/NEW2 domain-containing protein [Nocardia carnea]|uniref:NPCBM/NEW2 domain-containing protein n=1 Tax=Nocardia carnea TaxID=37328 RepID=UPI002455B4AE|nr:NPCBM/NEW2 domain-containing protein [Nocardia carnea]